MVKERTEQTCKECGNVDVVTKIYNCTACRVENISEEPTKKIQKKGDKKWLS